MKNMRLILVPSTHWDREWYKSEAEFNVHLTELFDQVLARLESGELSNFHTDGQSVIVEDMLTRKPEWRKRIARFASEGKLEVGPFYALTDMFMPSGESCMRNMFYGVEVVSSLGGKPGIPYAPDAFGHQGDLPAILRAAGFDAYFCCRGLGDQLNPPRAEFIWSDRSGNSRVLVLAGIVDIFEDSGKWVSGAYGLAMNLPQKDGAFRARLELFMKRLREYSDLPMQLAMNGSDHLLPEDDLQGRLDRFNASGADFTAETSTLAEYVTQAWKHLDVGKLPVVTGDLTDGRFFLILTGTSSSRTELKIRNARCQTLLEKLAEPALAMADAGRRALYQEHLDAAWKDLLKNQTHDSLSGCSTDAVHRKMMVRFDQIEASMRPIADRLLRARCGITELRTVMPPPTADSINVAIGHCCSDGAQGKLRYFSIIHPADVDLRQYLLADNQGICHDFIAVPEAERSTTNGPFLPSGPDGRVCSRTTIYTAMPLPEGFCTAGVTLKRRAALPPSEQPLPIELADGHLDLLLPHQRVSDWLALEDVQDVGDEYNFRPGSGAVRRVNVAWREISRQISASLFSVEYATYLNLPEAEGSRRKVRVPVFLQVVGAFGEPNLLLLLKVDNTAKDHRLQLKVKTPFRFTEYARQSQFQHWMTSVAPKKEPDSWREKTEPMRRNFGFLHVSGKKGAFAIFPEGLHEHCTDGASFSLTLFRAVANLGRTGAGPAIVTSDSQEPGMREFRIGISWQESSPQGNEPWKIGERLLVGGHAVVLHPKLSPEMKWESALSLRSEQLMISAFYYDKVLGRTLVRIFNPTSADGSGTLSGTSVPAKIQRVTYDHAIPSLGKMLSPRTITLKTGEIATFALR